MFVAGKYETSEAASWDEGDWDGDGVFSTNDFVSAFTDGGYEQGPLEAVRAVPEPAAAMLLLVGLMAIFPMRRKV